MPNIATFLKQEIARIARKEVRGNTQILQRASATQRKQISDLKQRLQHLERELGRLRKRSSKPKTEQAPEESRALRFRAGGFKAHRERLGLSAKDVGALIGASALSVYKWEQGKTRPRPQHLAAIAKLRAMGKREALQRLDELAGAQ
jgi:DNA-binding transcriptional regulator YiaG